MCWTATHDLHPVVHAPATARGFVRDALAGVLSDRPERHQIVHTSELIVSELVTNAVRAKAHLLRVELAVHRDVMRISVIDDAPGWPKLRSHTDPRAINGRGLPIVAICASAWAVEQLVPGKLVWAEIAVPERLTLDMANCNRPVRFAGGATPAKDGVAGDQAG
jgi:serine/threonine-protein kinase RsbW